MRAAAASHHVVTHSARLARARSRSLQGHAHDLGHRSIELRYASGRLRRAYWGQVFAMAQIRNSGRLPGSGVPVLGDEGAGYWARGVPFDRHRYDIGLDVVATTLVLELDHKGFFTRCSGGSAELVLGCSAAELVGQHLSVLYDAAAVANFQAERDMTAAVASSGLAEMAWRVRPDGTRLWASMVLNPLYGDHGKVVGFTLMLRAEDVGSARHDESNG
jgi:hypothetical protein